MSGITVKFDTQKAVKQINKFNLLVVERVKDEIEATKQEVVTDAKKKITQDKHIDTGRLRASIGVLSFRRDGLGVEVGTKVEYAEKIEKIDSFLFHAWEENRAKFINRLKKIL